MIRLEQLFPFRCLHRGIETHLRTPHSWFCLDGVASQAHRFKIKKLEKGP